MSFPAGNFQPEGHTELWNSYWK